MAAVAVAQVSDGEQCVSWGSFFVYCRFYSHRMGQLRVKIQNVKCRKRCTLFKVKKDFTLVNQNLLWYQKVSINIFKSVKIHSDGWEILRKPSVHGLRFTRYWTVCFLQLLKWFTSMVLPEIFIGINPPGFFFHVIYVLYVLQ